MKQYPYFIYYQKPGAEASQDSEGNFTEAQPLQWFFFSKCRNSISKNGRKGNFRSLVDGKTYEYSYTIYAPKNKTILPEGTQVLVYQEEITDPSIINEQFIIEGIKTGKVRVYMPIVGFEAGQHNTRIWI